MGRCSIQDSQPFSIWTQCSIDQFAIKTVINGMINISDTPDETHLKRSFRAHLKRRIISKFRFNGLVLSTNKWKLSTVESRSFTHTKRFSINLIRHRRTSENYLVLVKC